MSIPAATATTQTLRTMPHIPSLLQFLEGLAANNNRSWFLHNKPQHEILHEEFIALIAAVGERMQALDPAIDPFDAAKAVYRIYRDVRLSKDKSPFKTHMGGVIGKRNVSDKSRPIYYFQIDHLGLLTINAGIYLPSPDVLKKIRDHIVARPLLLGTLLSDRNFLKTYGGFSPLEALTRPPKGYAADHPHIAVIMNRHFVCETRMDLKSAPVKDLASTLSTRFADAIPMMAWLRNATI